MQSLRAMRREYTALIDETFDEIIPRAEQEIAKAYHDASEAWTREMIEAHEQAGQEIPWVRLPVADANELVTETVQGHEVGQSFFKADPKRLEIIAKDVRRDMDRARYATIERSGAQYKEILMNADAYVQTGTMTPLDAVEKASQECADQGLNAVRYENGNIVNVASYVDMALRTSAHRAVLTAEGSKREEWGFPLVISPALHSTCDICLKWQGRILIDDVYAQIEPDKAEGVKENHERLSTAVKEGFIHPNCRHPLVTYVEGITQIPTKSPHDKTRRQYNAEQKQRSIERGIRRWKRRQAIAEGEQELRMATAKVKEWQARMRDHLDKNPQLRRNPKREKLMVG